MAAYALSRRRATDNLAGCEPELLMSLNCIP
jgi:hypothetical protein